MATRAASPATAEKARAREAHELAIRSDPSRRALYDRWISETTDFVRQAGKADQFEYWRRTRILLECVADRSSWPRSFT